MTDDLPTTSTAEMKSARTFVLIFAVGVPFGCLIGGGFLALLARDLLARAGWIG